MRRLLETHAFLWWRTADQRLSPTVRQIVAAPEHTILFSAASAWELAIKVQLVRLRLSADLEAFIAEQLTANSFSVLPISVQHALHVRTLPALHRDPFNRLLVAQALLEDVPLLSADALVAQYPVRIVW